MMMSQIAHCRLCNNLHKILKTTAYSGTCVFLILRVVFDMMFLAFLCSLIGVSLFW